MTPVRNRLFPSTVTLGHYGRCRPLTEHRTEIKTGMRTRTCVVEAAWGAPLGGSVNFVDVEEHVRARHPYSCVVRSKWGPNCFSRKINASKKEEEEKERTVMEELLQCDLLANLPLTSGLQSRMRHRAQKGAKHAKRKMRYFPGSQTLEVVGIIKPLDMGKCGLLLGVRADLSGSVQPLAPYYRHGAYSHPNAQENHSFGTIVILFQLSTGSHDPCPVKLRHTAFSKRRLRVHWPTSCFQ